MAQREELADAGNSMPKLLEEEDDSNKTTNGGFQETAEDNDCVEEREADDVVNSVFDIDKNDSPVSDHEVDDKGKRADGTKAYKDPKRWRAESKEAKPEESKPEKTEDADDSVNDPLVNFSLFGIEKMLSEEEYLVKHKAMFNKLGVITYEEVVKLPYFQRRTIVLLGAPGVGRRRIRNTMIARYPKMYGYPIPHTTRPPRAGEVNGQDFFFVTNEEMMAGIEANEYLEYGSYDGVIYGTKIETIRRIHSERRTAILDVEPHALKILRTAEFAPYVVFVSAPPINYFYYDESKIELVRQSEQLRRLCGHYCDVTLAGRDADDALAQLEVALVRVHLSPQSVPASWLYKPKDKNLFNPYA